MKTLQSTFVVLVMLVLSSCATPESGGTTKKPAGAKAKQEQPALASSAAELAEKGDENRRQPVMYRGDDQMVNMPAKQEPVKFIGDDVSLNFEQAPLSEVTHAILGDILKVDYVVDRPIQGQVTLRTRTPIPRNQLLEVLESLLRSNGTIMIRGSDGRYLITGEKEGETIRPLVSNPDDREAGFATIIVPLQFISASNMAEILRPVASESAFVRIDNSRNLLMLAGTRLQLNGWLQMISTFDVDQLKGMSVGLFPLHNSTVDEVSAALQAMMGSEEGGSMKDLIRVVPVQRLNSILIVTPRAHYLDSMQKWIERLDEAQYSEYDSRLYVYPVQNTTAARLADLINSIYSGSSTQRRESNAPVRDAGGVAPGMSPESIGSTGGGSMGGGSTTTGSRSTAASTGTTSATLKLDTAGQDAQSVPDVRVVADDENNALMIYASAMQYRVIESALKQLDIEATQVIIEASIMEVTLTDELRYGLEWMFTGKVGGSHEGTGILSSIAEATGPSSILPGFTYTVTNSAGDINAVLNALAKDSLLNIISTPSVMVLDNHSAYIHVGQQVPIIQSQATPTTNIDNNLIVQSITYKDTGVQLDVTPSVNAGGLVTMDVKQSVSDVGAIDTATGQNSFLERTIESKVAVRSGESVVLGGLIRENASNSSQGLPWLHNIPLLGWLFGAEHNKSDRTELLVIITPRALYNAQEIREVSEEMRTHIRGMKLIESSGS